MNSSEINLSEHLLAKQVEFRGKINSVVKIWVLPFLLFHLATQVSLFFRIPNGCSLFYLPIPLSIILIHWWGPRVIAGLVLNSFITLFIWDAKDFSLWPIVITHEAAGALTSWFLFRIKFKGKIWLPDIHQTLYFILLGILIPVTVNSLYVLFLSKNSQILTHTVMIWAADFASSFSISLPMIYFLTPWLERNGAISNFGSSDNTIPNSCRMVKKHKIQFFFSVIGLPAISLVLPIEKYWFLYGLFTIYIAIRFGFGNSLLANGMVFLVTYVMPFIFTFNKDLSWAVESNLINVHLGMIMLSVAACITGRVISDLRNAEHKLQSQFAELERTNQELDRFVYSASHDLSAPMKSMLGLINISRMETDSSKKGFYIDKMEKCIVKSEGFIQEIIDYSKNNRSSIHIEKVRISEVLSETLEELKDIPNFDRVSIHSEGLIIDEMSTDRLRIKIILNNIISNAIQYQRNQESHESKIWIRSEENQEYTKIQIKDNGQGIRKDVSDKIFGMFFRGTTSSTGSGLGLYIAKNAVEKMNGKIEFQSTFGEGSIFTIYILK